MRLCQVGVLFPDGVAAGPPVEKDYIFSATGQYAEGSDIRPTIVLPTGEFGVGFSPLDPVLPIWDCDSDPNNLLDCGPAVANIFGDFKYAVIFDPTAPGQHLFMDDQLTSCAGVTAPTNMTFNGCDCSGPECTINIKGATSCGNPGPNCDFGESYGNSVAFNDGIGTASILMINDKAQAMLDARAALFNIFGTVDGSRWRLFDRYAPHNVFGSDSNENYGIIGDLRDFLGPEEAGGLLFKQGFTTCASLGTIPGSSSFDFTLDNNDDQGGSSGGGGGNNCTDETQGHVEISAGTMTIPSFIFNASGTSNSAVKFGKRIEISLTGCEDEEIIIELNCAGDNGGTNVGVVAFKGNRENTFNNITEIESEREAVFWNTTNPLDKRIEAYSVRETRLKSTNAILRKEWNLTRSVTPDGNPAYIRGWATGVRYSNEQGGVFYSQSRAAFSYKQPIARLHVDGKFFGNSTYTSDSNIVGDLLDTNAKCINLDKLVIDNDLAGNCNTVVDATTAAKDRPIIDKTSGLFSMDWVGKPNASFVSPMETAFDAFFGI